MKRVIALSLLIFISICVYSQDTGLPGYFLEQGMGARALSMGRGFSAVADDVSALYWNPAGLSQLTKRSLSVTHIDLFVLASYDSIGYASPFKNNIYYGIGLVRLYSGEIERVDSSNMPSGVTSAQDMGLLLSGAYLLNDKLSLGTGTNIVNKSFDDINMTWAGIDAALLYNYNESMHFGLTAKNIITLISGKPSNREYLIPLTTKFGFSYKLPKNNILLAADIDDLTELHAGVEWRANDLLRVRCGYDNGNTTAGIGIETRLYQLDLALLNHALGHSLSISLSFDF